jgi:hypothetical protein
MNLADVGGYIGLYQYESDYFTNHTIAAMGRYLVFNVLHPSEKMHLIMDITDTLRPNRDDLPQPSVSDLRSAKIVPAYGRGSARLISPPIQPMMIDGQAFVAVDMNREPNVNPDPPRTGLMRLFGNDIPLDPRKFVVYTRGISAISDEEYRAMKPPSSVSRFPYDLLENHALEYSGIYEDGWASEDFAARMSAAPGKSIVVAGMVPDIGDSAFTTEATVFVDGQAVLRQKLGLGNFQLSIIAHASTAQVRVRFSRTQRLPRGDNRVVSALLKRIGSDVTETAAR